MTKVLRLLQAIAMEGSTGSLYLIIMSVGFSGLFQSVYKLHVTENPNGCWRLAMVYFVQVSLAGGDLLLGVCL